MSRRQEPAFHSQILNHVENPYGMFGMVTAMVAQ